MGPVPWHTRCMVNQAHAVSKESVMINTRVWIEVEDSGVYCNVGCVTKVGLSLEGGAYVVGAAAGEGWAIVEVTRDFGAAFATFIEYARTYGGAK